MSPRQRAYYQGIPLAPYDLIKEGLIGLLVVTVLVCGLAVALSSPDEPPLTVQHVAATDPLTFMQTALGELDGTDSISTYGPPYNSGSGSVQSLGPVSFQRLAGVHIPIDTAQDMVLGPLRRVAQLEPPVAAALRTFDGATPARQAAWEAAYGTALAKARVQGTTVGLPAGGYGPVAPMLAGLLALGRSGLLEPAVDNSPRIYSTDNTRSILFLQSAALPAAAASFHLIGSQWGMMNETGNYPGQAWLWLYTLGYQVPAYASSPNADVLVMATTVVLTLVLVLLPWIPGLNRLPRLLGVYRLIWRDYYRARQATTGPTPASADSDVSSGGVP
jgi:hypothetical protein